MTIIKHVCKYASGHFSSFWTFLFTLRVGTAMVENSIGQMKMMKVNYTVHSKLDSVNLVQLPVIRIAVEGPELFTTNFSGILGNSKKEGIVKVVLVFALIQFMLL